MRGGPNWRHALSQPGEQSRDEGVGGAALQEHFRRTRGSIAARLVKLGLLTDKADLTG